MLSLALMLEGAKRADAAKAGGMDRQTLGDWVHRFNAEGPEGLYSKAGTGPPCRLSEAQQQDLAALIESGPNLAKHGVVRFRFCDLCALVEERFGVTDEKRGLSKLIRRWGFRKISPPKAIPKSRPSAKKFQDLVLDAISDRAAERPIEIWFVDEARVGQKGQLSRQGARRGSRPGQPKDQRCKAACLFAAACPETSKAAALVRPHANTQAMSLHLAEISTQVTGGAHAVVILDQAGWRAANNLDRPDTISLLFLPPHSPELNPIENLFQVRRHNVLNARVHDAYDDIVDA
jgi:transposase